MIISSILRGINPSIIPLYHHRNFSANPETSSILKVNGTKLDMNKILDVGYYRKKIWWHYPYRLWIEYDEEHTHFQTILIPAGLLLVPFQYPITLDSQTFEWKYVAGYECKDDYNRINDKLKEFRKSKKI